MTVQQFYEKKIVNELSSAEEVKLEVAFLGKSKESLDRIDLTLMLDSAIQLFGPFLCYHTRSTEQVLPPVHDAFAVLMASQRQLSMSGLPPCVIVRSNKDKLYNDFIGLLKEGVSFPATEVNSSGRNFTKMGTMIHCRSSPVQFLNFSNALLDTIPLNFQNTASAMLSTQASSLFQNRQGSFWSHASLQRLYQQTRSLAQSLARYVDYLSSQNKIMKDLHARSNPVRQLSDSMSVKYIEPCRGVPIGRLEPLFGCLQERMVNTLH